MTRNGIAYVGGMVTGMILMAILLNTRGIVKISLLSVVVILGPLLTHLAERWSR